VYGTAFASRDDLKAHLARLEEAKRRDHRVLGKQLDLFSVDELVGPGFVLWHPKGAIVRTVLEDMIRRELVRRGYQAVFTPHVAREQLLVKSGHMEHYKENLFGGMELDGQRYLVRPMNCPFHIAIYRSQLRSHRELPVRYAELGSVYRYERSGVLHGLLRVRGFYPRRRPPVPARRPDRRGTGGLCALRPGYSQGLWFCRRESLLGHSAGEFHGRKGDLGPG